jgi:hypothetical protein
MLTSSRYINLSQVYRALMMILIRLLKLELPARLANPIYIHIFIEDFTLVRLLDKIEVFLKSDGEWHRMK